MQSKLRAGLGSRSDMATLTSLLKFTRIRISIGQNQGVYCHRVGDMAFLSENHMSTNSYCNKLEDKSATL